MSSAQQLNIDSSHLVKDVSRIRFMFRHNNRLKLEFLATLSKLFREHEISIEDKLLASVILAVPEELSDQENLLHGGLLLKKKGELDVPQPTQEKTKVRPDVPQPTQEKKPKAKKNGKEHGTTKKGSKKSSRKKT